MLGFRTDDELQRCITRTDSAAKQPAAKRSKAHNIPAAAAVLSLHSCFPVAKSTGSKKQSTRIQAKSTPLHSADAMEPASSTTYPPQGEVAPATAMHVTPAEPTQPLVEQASNYFKTVVTKGNPEDFVIQRPKSSTDVEELNRASGAAGQAAALYITKPPLAIEDDLSLPANKVHAELRKTWTKYIEEHTPRGEMAVAATAAAWTAYREEFATILNDTNKDNIIDPDTDASS